jgi:ribonuclease HI
MAGRFYAVAVGRAPGIYADWPLAKEQVDGFPGARYKGFADRAEAEARLRNPQPRHARRQPAERKINASAREQRPEAGAAEGVVIYTDGSCLGNPGPGGYGVIIRENGQERQLSGGFRRTTNNRMEIMAAITGLKAAGTGMAGTSTIGASQEVIHLYSDSSYLVNAIEKGWAKNWARRGWRKADGQPAQNCDLWQEMLALLAVRKVILHWLPGHAGHDDNERCDRLALLAAKAANLPEDTGYHAGNQP